MTIVSMPSRASTSLLPSEEMAEVCGAIIVSMPSRASTSLLLDKWEESYTANRDDVSMPSRASTSLLLVVLIRITVDSIACVNALSG